MRAVSILGVALAVMSCPVLAQNAPEPLLGIDITPNVGYRTNINFITEPGVDGINPRVSLDSGPSRGLAVGVRYNDGDVVEFRWSRQDTYMNVVGPVLPPFRERVTLDQFHMDCSHEYVVDEWPLWARPFIMASVGATRVSSTSGSPSFTRFSFGIGGGVKAFPFRRFGLKIQAEWLPLWVNPEVRALCGYGCVIFLSGRLAHQAEVSISPVFRF